MDSFSHPLQSIVTRQVYELYLTILERLPGFEPKTSFDITEKARELKIFVIRDVTGNVIGHELQNPLLSSKKQTNAYHYPKKVEGSKLVKTLYRRADRGKKERK